MNVLSKLKGFKKRYSSNAVEKEEPVMKETPAQPGDSLGTIKEESFGLSKSAPVNYQSFSCQRKYEDLLMYMTKYPGLEAHIFNFFYVRLKPIVEMGDDDVLQERKELAQEDCSQPGCHRMTMRRRYPGNCC